ncbi:MAG: phosphodiester glycosidase family protein, partial [Paludibacteraceae bacterium]|nr:phosphodiester glycosidase family protein [Paludibacteraceae bacterium]
MLGDVCVLYHDGVMETVSSAAYDYDAIVARSPYQIWCFGPALLHADGSARLEAEYDTAAYDNNLVFNRHPRTAVGYFEPGHYALLTVDGRTEQSYGMRVLQLGRIFEEMGCKAAYNFDGGDSCQAYYDGQFVRQAEGR